MIETKFKNRQTREAFITVVLGCEDPRRMAADWLDMAGFLEGAVPMLADQLRRDMREDWVCCGHPLLRALMLPTFNRIDWQEIAGRFLMCYGPRQPAALEGDTQSG